MKIRLLFGLLLLSVLSAAQNVVHSAFGDYTTVIGCDYPNMYSAYKAPTLTSESVQYTYSAPSRAAAKDSGSQTVTVDGVTVTVSWEVKGALFGLFIWTITYSDGTSEIFYGSESGAISKATSTAKDKAKEEAEERAAEMRTPIGDDSILLLFVSMFLMFRCVKQTVEKAVWQYHMTVTSILECLVRKKGFKMDLIINRV